MNYIYFKIPTDFIYTPSFFFVFCLFYSVYFSFKIKHKTHSGICWPRERIIYSL